MSLDGLRKMNGDQIFYYPTFCIPHRWITRERERECVKTRAQGRRKCLLFDTCPIWKTCFFFLLLLLMERRRVVFYFDKNSSLIIDIELDSERTKENCARDFKLFFPFVFSWCHWQESSCAAWEINQCNTIQYALSTYRNMRRNLLRSNNLTIQLTGWWLERKRKKE